jgi:ABC-2 type transport system ATP-binding protein
VKIESLGKRYGARQPWVIRDVTADVAQGRLIRVEGRNGSGKSTLLRVIAGILTPSAGKITDRPHTGYVPERFPPALPFSGRDYLLHLGRVHGLRGATLAARAEENLARLGAASFAATPMRALSKGMCQKIAVAQALLAQPGLLVLDEAWTGLDAAARDALDAAVAERLAEGGRVFFVDHEQRRLASLVSARWQIGDGRVTVAAVSEPARREPAVIIEVSGAAPEVAATLGPMRGVEVVREDAGNLVVHADQAVSDEVLRAVLATGTAHVLAVRADPGERA